MTACIKHKGWVLIDTISGWFAARGNERMRVCAHTGDLNIDVIRKFKAKVDEREGE